MSVRLTGFSLRHLCRLVRNKIRKKAFVLMHTRVLPHSRNVWVGTTLKENTHMAKRHWDP